MLAAPTTGRNKRGLLLSSNPSFFTHRSIHPSFHCDWKFHFHLKNSVPKYIFHSQSFTSYWPFSANACSFSSIYRALYYLRLLNYFSNGLNIIFLGPSVSLPALNIFANHGSQINHIRIFETLENIDLQQNQSQRAVPCQNCPNAPASACRWKSIIWYFKRNFVFISLYKFEFTMKFWYFQAKELRAPLQVNLFP